VENRTGRAAFLGTPTIFPTKLRAEVVTNGSNFIRGYDPASGKELWRLGGSSKITAPTPVASDDLIVVASGRRPEAPIFCHTRRREREITGSRSVAGPNNSAALTCRRPDLPRLCLYPGQRRYLDCYALSDGREIYRQRIPGAASGFSSSPVASDGKIYLSSEDGEIVVVKAGPSSSFWQATTWPIPSWPPGHLRRTADCPQPALPLAIGQR